MHAPPRKKRNSAKVNLILSTIFHALVIGGLFFFAAREGLLGQKLKTIAVQMAPKEKPAEKKPEDKKPEEPKVEPVKTAEAPKVAPPQKVAEAPKITPVTTAPMVAPPPVVAPSAMDVGGFSFTDDSAKAVQSSSDPIIIYKGLVEYSLRSKWTRPAGVDDVTFVAEVDVTIDPGGKVTGVEWRKGSGDNRWDESVRQALKQTAAINRPPPKNFPARVLVRFDTQFESEPITVPGQP